MVHRCSVGLAAALCCSALALATAAAGVDDEAGAGVDDEAALFQVRTRTAASCAEHTTSSACTEFGALGAACAWFPPVWDPMRPDGEEIIFAKCGPAPDYSALGNVPQATTEKSKKLRVAFAVFVTDVGSAGYHDALRVMAHGILKAAAKSRHEVHLVALSPERLASDHEQLLLEAGFEKVVRKPVPVNPDEVKGGNARFELNKLMGGDVRSQFKMAEETIKYQGLSMTEYDRVLVLDADMMILDPMDELMELEEDFIMTYDHGLDCCGSQLPPAQGGFLLFRPNLTDFEQITELTREGDWGGNGWKQSGIGYWYGGVGPDGLLSYYFNRDALSYIKTTGKTNMPESVNAARVPGSRMKAVERTKYDVLYAERLRDDLVNVTSLEEQDEVVKGVTSVHFTGNCVKPWQCNGESPHWLCRAVSKRWWDERLEVAEALGQRADSDMYFGCRGGYRGIGTSV